MDTEKPVDYSSLTKDLYAKRNEEKKKELLKAVENSTKTYEEIMAFICFEDEKIRFCTVLMRKCELPVNLRLKLVYPHKYWIFYGNIGEPVVVNTH